MRNFARLLTIKLTLIIFIYHLRRLYHGLFTRSITMYTLEEGSEGGWKEGRNAATRRIRQSQTESLSRSQSNPIVGAPFKVKHTDTHCQQVLCTWTVHSHHGVAPVNWSCVRTVGSLIMHFVADTKCKSWGNWSEKCLNVTVESVFLWPLNEVQYSSHHTPSMAQTPKSSALQFSLVPNTYGHVPDRLRVKYGSLSLAPSPAFLRQLIPTCLLCTFLSLSPITSSDWISSNWLLFVIGDLWHAHWFPPTHATPSRHVAVLWPVVSDPQLLVQQQQSHGSITDGWLQRLFAFEPLTVTCLWLLVRLHGTIIDFLSASMSPPLAIRLFTHPAESWYLMRWSNRHLCSVAKSTSDMQADILANHRYIHFVYLLNCTLNHGGGEWTFDIKCAPTWFTKTIHRLLTITTHDHHRRRVCCDWTAFTDCSFTSVYTLHCWLGSSPPTQTKNDDKVLEFDV